MMNTYYSQRQPGFVLIVIASLICLALMFTSCSSDNPSDEELFLNKLQGNWTLSSGKVTVDGLDISEAFNGMEITFSKDGSYSVQHGVVPIWPDNGTFTVSKSSTGQFTLLRSDDVSMTATDLTATSVKLSFHYDAANGRMKSISGQYEFYLSR